MTLSGTKAATEEHIHDYNFILQHSPMQVVLKHFCAYAHIHYWKHLVTAPPPTEATVGEVTAPLCVLCDGCKMVGLSHKGVQCSVFNRTLNKMLFKYITDMYLTILSSRVDL